MIVTWAEGTDCSAARLVLRATPEDYDAFPPVDALIVDDLPLERNPDRVALASYLAFGAWTSGDFLVPLDLGPATAEAVETDAKPLPIRPRPIAYAARALSQGRSTVEVRFSLPTKPAAHAVLAVVPSTKAYGVFRTGTTTVVPSNAFVLDMAAELPAPSVRARLGVAVLFADDIGASTLRLIDAVSDPLERARIQTLVRSVNLDVVFD